MSFYSYCRICGEIHKLRTDQSRQNGFGYFFEIVRGTDHWKFTGYFFFAPHTEAAKPTIFDLPEYWFHDDFTLLINRLGRGCRHFAIQVLS